MPAVRAKAPSLACLVKNELSQGGRRYKVRSLLERKVLAERRMGEFRERVVHLGSLNPV